MIRRQGTDAPAAEHVGGEQPAGDRGGVAYRDDAGREQVPIVGVDRADLLLVGPERQGVALLFGHPVGRVELTPERGGAADQAGGEGAVTAGGEGEGAVAKGA